MKRTLTRGYLVSVVFSASIQMASSGPIVCVDNSAVCTPNWSVMTDKRCWPASPTGCCQEKDWNYTCTPGGTVYRITHEYYNVFGACTGDDCL